MESRPAHNDPDSLTTNSPETDPARWGHSLANAIEIVLPILDAAEATSVAEVGAYAGDLTGRLLEWSETAGATVTAIDPLPAELLVELADKNPRLNLIRSQSHVALAEMEIPDAVIIDGDHNYYTVSEELRAISERTVEADRSLPLLLFHDVGWPHARRDAYYTPESIPEQDRQPIVDGGALFPGEPEVVGAGLPYRWPAVREGGERNGVRTAIEDFVADRPRLHFAAIPVFFGVGVVWDEDAGYASDLAELTGAWDRHPVLERLEANRVFHLSMEYVQRGKVEEERRERAKLETFLRELLDSSAFGVADRLAVPRRERGADSWRDQIRALLGDEG